jgi:putative peptide zinc metalloprotease protein
MGQITWIVKNPETMKYYYFEDSEWGLIELFDGTRTPEEVLDDYKKLFPNAGTPLSLIIEYEDLLRHLELLERGSAEKSLALLSKLRTARQRAADEKTEGFNPFFIPFHVIDPDRFLNRTVRFVRWIWTPAIVLIWAILVGWTVGVFIRNWAPIFTGTYELYAFLRKPLLDAIQFFCLLSIIGGIHELGHAYAVKIYGGEVHDIGIALLYFTPAFYCDTTDSLLFESRWQRLWVTTAGIYIEGFLCSAATALWVASYPDSLLHELAYKTMLFTGVSTIFFNVNPLVKIDGYYALTSLVNVSELREESFRYLGAVFQKRVLRLPIEIPPAGRRKTRIYWIYGVLALAYTAVIMRFIGGIFYNLYERYLPDFAVALLVLTLYRIFRKRVRLVTRTARLVYLDKKERLMSNRKRLLLITALLVVVLLIPWTRRTITGEAILRPRMVGHVEAPEDGIVSRVLTREGAIVEVGDPLIQMRSLAAEADSLHFAAAHQRFARAANTARESAAADVVYEKERRESAASVAELNDKARARRLVLGSPVKGRVLSPRLEDLEGRFVTAGTALAEVGECETLVADLPVSERRLDELQVGIEVRALAPQRPTQPIQGTILSISAATVDRPPTVAGLIDPAVPALRPDRFLALAAFDNPQSQLRPGDRVRAKIYAQRTSYAARAWRVLRRWLQTIFW